MTNDAQIHINQIKNQARITYLDISNRDLGGSADLKGFAALKSLNAYSNQFENLDCLNNLPNKEKLQKINFYGSYTKGDVIEPSPYMADRESYILGLEAKYDIL